MKRTLIMFDLQYQLNNS